MRKIEKMTKNAQENKLLRSRNFIHLVLKIISRLREKKKKHGLSEFHMMERTGV